MLIPMPNIPFDGIAPATFLFVINKIYKGYRLTSSHNHGLQKNNTIVIMVENGLTSWDNYYLY
jgi:hypothetical protein